MNTNNIWQPMPILKAGTRRAVPPIGRWVLEAPAPEVEVGPPAQQLGCQAFGACREQKWSRNEWKQLSASLSFVFWNAKIWLIVPKRSWQIFLDVHVSTWFVYIVCQRIFKGIYISQDDIFATSPKSSRPRQVRSNRGLRVSKEKMVWDCFGTGFPPCWVAI